MVWQILLGGIMQSPLKKILSEPEITSLTFQNTCIKGGSSLSLSHPLLVKSRTLQIIISLQPSISQSHSHTTLKLQSLMQPHILQLFQIHL